MLISSSLILDIGGLTTKLEKGKKKYSPTSFCLISVYKYINKVYDWFFLCRKNFFQEGETVLSKLKVTEAYTKALKTWAEWVDKNVNKNKTQVFFAGYSTSHFR